MATVVVVGAGFVGLPVALELLKRGHEVHVIADKLPGQGITSDLAAGIGCVFKPSSQLVGDLVLQSYPEWMRDARDCRVPAVLTTRLVTHTDAGTPAWADAVEEYDAGIGWASYLTYAFSPIHLGQHRLNTVLGMGATIHRRPLGANEVGCLLAGRSLPGSDYTVRTLGLNARVIRPDFLLYGVRGLLVHFAPSTDGISFMSEEACSYVISRPGGLVVGGTFDRHVETCSQEEQHEIGEQIVVDANRRFGLKLDFSERVRITVGYRPAVNGDPVLEFGDQVSHVTGLGGQGWVTGPALSRMVVDKVEQRLVMSS